MKLKSLLFLLLITISFNSYSQKTKKYPSLLWEITGNGLKQPSYLYGTMHVSERVAYHLSDTFFVALKKCDVVALESDPRTWLAKSLESKTFNRFGNSIFTKNSSFFENSFQVRSYDKEDIEGMFKMEPSMINGIMYRRGFGTGNFEEDTYLDMFIFQAGNKLGKLVTNLEDDEKTDKMVEKAYKRDKGEKPNYNYDYDYRDLGEMIEDAYRKGDLDLLDSLSSLRNPTKNYRKWMLDERNIIMAYNMDSIMKIKSLFTAVGAAHLPGQMGLIELLRAKGYTLRPVTYTATKNAIKTKEKIDKMYAPVKFVDETDPTGTVSYTSTGKMLQVPSYKQGGTISLNLELVNGTYSMMTRYHTRAILQDKDREYVTKQVDSMLFESLPGKIQYRKNSTSKEGYGVIETAVKTRQGDLVRYKIFITPMEVIVFTIGGRAETVANKDYNKVFDNIKFNPNQDGWSTADYSDYGFSVDLPGIRSVDKNGNTSISIDAFDPKTSDYMVTRKGIYNDLDDLESDTFEVGYLTKSFYKDTDYKPISRDLQFKNGYPVLYTLLKDDKGKYLHLKFMIYKQHYFMQACYSANENRVNKYWDSFKIKIPEDNQTYKNYEDTAALFSANLPEEFDDDLDIDTYQDYNEYYYDYDYGYDEEEEEEDPALEQYREKNVTHDFANKLTQEIISVDYHQYSRYFRIEDDEKEKFLKFDGVMYFEKNGYKQKNYKKEEVDGRIEVSYDLVDSTTVRKIHVKQIIKNSVAYRIRYYTDTLTPPTKFYTEFFNTFTIKDTVIGSTIFESKKNIYLNDLKSDSTLQTLAFESIGEVNFDDEDAPELLAFMRTPEFKETKSEFKEDYYRELMSLQHDSLAEFFNKQYSTINDSFELQLNCLRGMINQKTKKSYGYFLNNILEDMPLSKEKYGIESMFMSTYDSLELAATLFPRILELTRYEEYKVPVYRLFLKVLDKKLVNKDILKNNMNDIFRDANETLKRTLVDEKDKRVDIQSESIPDIDELRKMIDRDPKLKARAEKELKKMGMTLEEMISMTMGTGMKEDILTLYTKLCLLFPSDASAKKYLEKIENSKNQNLIFKLHLQYIEEGIAIHDSILKSYAKDPLTRVSLYKTLKNSKKDSLFDSFYYTQQSFVESHLISQKKLEPNKDSLVFIEKQFVINNVDTGYVMVYKYKFKDRSRWNLYFSGFQPEDPLKVNTTFAYSDSQYMYSEKEDEITKVIDNKIEGIRNSHRKRIRASRYSNSELYDYYEDYEDY